MSEKRKDPGHVETDELIEKLEKKLKTVYSQASIQAQKNFKDYMADFERKDRIHRLDVKAGRWTEKQYKDWRKNQLLVSKRFQDMADVLSQDLHNVDKIAMKMARDAQMDVYALNHNYGTYEVEHGAGVDTSYTLYDHDTVERLVKEDPRLLPKPSKKRQAEIDAKDIKWNKQKLQTAFTVSLLNGDDVYTMAEAISKVAQMDHVAAVRNARTMCTGAECGGRINAYERCKRLGISLRQAWSATLDERTRASHRLLDGEIVDVGARFSNGCRFPGDPEGAPAEVYNCRCTVVSVVDGINPMAFDKTDTLRRKTGNMNITYRQWKKGHDKKKKKKKK